MQIALSRSVSCSHLDPDLVGNRSLTSAPSSLVMRQPSISTWKSGHMASSSDTHSSLDRALGALPYGRLYRLGSTANFMIPQSREEKGCGSRGTWDRSECAWNKSEGCEIGIGMDYRDRDLCPLTWRCILRSPAKGADVLNRSVDSSCLSLDWCSSAARCPIPRSFVSVDGLRPQSRSMQCRPWESSMKGSAPEWGQ